MNISGIIRTTHHRAQCIADAVSTDNLSEMRTWAEGNSVITRIASSKVRSVIASMDDYLMNLTVAEDVCEKSIQTDSSGVMR
ncbi:KEOPS complex subunit Pcc1 [Methanospirillum sp.]|uniref:KEOPS complex subunit Pcc1 n=1 Tax=Methanospirillum sp. TaxID=45200 RepID=UPI002CB0E56B|nr:KEOPS complex subunit Pcc1 [Methanospirillum sp.]HPP77695.1 KEOPS complex subunit Pcc1 [Methanospirillum sp.]